MLTFYLRKSGFLKISLLNGSRLLAIKAWKVTYHVGTLTQFATIFVPSEVHFFVQKGHSHGLIL